jgi:hypothetical protein
MLFSPGRQKTIDRATRPLAGDPHEEAIEKVRSISSVQRSSLFVYVKTWEIWRRAWKEICVQQMPQTSCTGAGACFLIAILYVHKSSLSRRQVGHFRKVGNW